MPLSKLELIPQILHHGAVDGVTGSCHEYRLSSGDDKLALLIDCGLFQGEEKGAKSFEQLEINFDIQHVSALIVTHVHIDHVGRIPYLLATGLVLFIVLKLLRTYYLWYLKTPSKLVLPAIKS